MAPPTASENNSDEVQAAAMDVTTAAAATTTTTRTLTAVNGDDDYDQSDTSSLLHWVKISVAHLQQQQEEEDDSDEKNNNATRQVWWPCRLYRDYADLYEQLPAETLSLLQRSDAKTLIGKRIVDNMLRGKRFQLAYLLGRPIQNVVEVIDPTPITTAAAAAAAATAGHCAFTSQRPCHSPEMLYEHQTLECKEFHMLTQDEWQSQLLLQPSSSGGGGGGVVLWNGNQNLYASFVQALDLARDELMKKSDDSDYRDSSIAAAEDGPFLALGRQEWQAHAHQSRNQTVEESKNEQEELEVRDDVAPEKTSADESTTTAAAALGQDQDMQDDDDDSSARERDSKMSALEDVSTSKLLGNEARDDEEQDEDEDVLDEEKSTPKDDDQEVEENDEQEEMEVPNDDDDDDEQVEDEEAEQNDSQVEEDAPETPKKASDAENTTDTTNDSSSSATIVTEASEESSSSSPSSHESDKDNHEDEDGELGIEPTATFNNILFKLQVDYGWEQISYQGQTVWIRPGKDPSANPNCLRGKDFFNVEELRQHLQAKYGWKEPITPQAKSKPTDTATKTKRGRKTAPSFVTPSPSGRPQRHRRRKVRDGEHDDEQSSPMKMSSKKPKKMFQFQSEEEEDFYTFLNLMSKLKRNKWGYRPGKFGGWTYIKPGHKGEKQGGKHMVDFFTEEHEVIEYCMKEKYFERREELGLEG
jgi:hypothetical protein